MNVELNVFKEFLVKICCSTIISTVMAARRRRGLRISDEGMFLRLRQAKASSGRRGLYPAQ